MAYNDASDTITALLTTSGFIESKETFTLDELPSSLSDKVFSITVDGIDKGTADINDRFFPVYQIKVTACYFAGNGKFELYENVIDWNEDLISLLVNPDNRDASVRQIDFVSSALSMNKSEAQNFVLIENIFNVETTLLYEPSLSDFVYTDTTSDEEINGGEYTTTNYPSTIQSGTY